MKKFELELSGYMTFSRKVVVEAESEEKAVEQVYSDMSAFEQHNDSWDNTSFGFVQDIEVLECDPVEE